MNKWIPCICWAVLLVFVGVSSVSAHTDPPIMQLRMDPDMPNQNEAARLELKLTGSRTGLPTIGAKVHVTATDSQGTKVVYQLQSPKAGFYTGTVIFPRLGMWDIRVEIEHENELDIRHYMVHVMKPVPGYHNVLLDEEVLAMDKNALGQAISPRLVLEGYVFLIVVLLVIVTLIKNRQKSKQRRAFLES